MWSPPPHNEGVETLMEAVLAAFPSVEGEETAAPEEPEGVIKLAIIGRPTSA
ncbi:MAG: hypothetical protein HC889_05610, partial [Synechococcaceae cyanobacterium SM1_2_3]|nr:hypothetical protein [Synechococcaceae cyanobacterium SM1_2_3]